MKKQEKNEEDLKAEILAEYLLIVVSAIAIFFLWVPLGIIIFAILQILFVIDMIINPLRIVITYRKVINNISKRMTKILLLFIIFFPLLSSIFIYLVINAA